MEGGGHQGNGRAGVMRRGVGCSLEGLNSGLGDAHDAQDFFKAAFSLWRCFILSSCLKRSKHREAYKGPCPSHSWGLAVQFLFRAQLRDTAPGLMVLLCAVLSRHRKALLELNAHHSLSCLATATFRTKVRDGRDTENSDDSV